MSVGARVTGRRVYRWVSIPALPECPVYFRNYKQDSVNHRCVLAGWWMDVDASVALCGLLFCINLGSPSCQINPLLAGVSDNT